jgi:L-iditol 2-dehydrogenase
MSSDAKPDVSQGPRKIRASVLHGAKDLRIVRPQYISTTVRPNFNPQEDRSIFPPGPTDLQISVRSTGLCGSDLHYYRHYRNGDIIVQEPMSLGHESAGVVVGLGSEVSDFKVGDKVALEVGQPCENCDRCKEGRYNICKGMRFRSSAKSFPHAQGTLQDRINHPAAWCHK